MVKYPCTRFGLGTYASRLCSKPNIRRVRFRSQMRESNGDSSVTRWRPRLAPGRPAADARSRAAGSAQPGIAVPSLPIMTGVSPAATATSLAAAALLSGP